MSSIKFVFHQPLVFAFLLTTLLAAAQTEQEKVVPEAGKSTKEGAVSETGKEILKSLDENDEESLAKNYEALAQKFIVKEQFAKAEEYLKKALAGYKSLKGTDKDVARVSRSLAKVQEKLNKNKAAYANYTMASDFNSNTAEKKVNLYDANRVVSSGASAPSYSWTPANATEKALESDISFYKQANMKAELQDVYAKKAQAQLFRNNPEGAIRTYDEAIRAAGDDKALIIRLKDKIAGVYVASRQFDKAIALHNELLKDADRSKNASVQVSQLRSLAVIYFETKQPETALRLLKRAFALALDNSYTREAKICLENLLNYYGETGNREESLALYEQFLGNFDELVRSDSSLIDQNTFRIIEGRIRQLEEEKKLKDRLIANTNTFNYFLIGSIGVLLVLLALFIRSLQSIKKRNKRIALQSLRREMNPHFIFNSLNSVNQFIAQNNELEANKYLTSYSNLMRTTMENSGKDFILLGKEVELLKKYLDLELMRFEDKFEFVITIDESLDLESSYVPNMLIQPNLENAIWHGLRYRDGKGLLHLRFDSGGTRIRVTIDDDGIGIAKSAELKTSNQKVYDSLGLKNTKERIALLNNLYRKDISFSMMEKPLPAQGTIVELAFPLMDKLPG